MADVIIWLGYLSDDGRGGGIYEGVIWGGPAEPGSAVADKVRSDARLQAVFDEGALLLVRKEADVTRAALRHLRKEVRRRLTKANPFPRVRANCPRLDEVLQRATEV